MLRDRHIDACMIEELYLISIFTVWHSCIDYILVNINIFSILLQFSMSILLTFSLSLAGGRE